MKTESRLSLLYFALGIIWILVSDSVLVGIFETRPDDSPLLGTFKGCLYVAVTAGLLYWLLRREFRMREQTEAELNRNRLFAQRVIETAPDAVMVYNADGLQAHYINEQVEAVFGYTPDEVRRLDGTFWEQVIVPADSQRVREYRERLLRDPESSPGEIEYTIRHKSGGLRTVVERTALFHPTPGSQTPALLALVRDITARKRDEEQLTYQANLLQNVNDAVISVDLNYCVTSWNQAAVEIYGYTPEEALGKPLRDLINTEYPDVGRERAMGQIFSEGTWRGETIQQRKDGTCLRALTSSRLLRDRRGEIVGIVTINRDITEQKRLEQEAREKEQLQAELNQALQNRALHSRFMSMVSHEFRTPLTTIQLAAELLKRYFDRLTPEARAERLRQIETEVERLLTMLDDILQVLKTEATRLHFRPEKVDLVAFTRQVVEDMRLAAQETHRLVFTSEEPELQAEVDPTLLRQALSNLLSNAMKYAPAGTDVNIDLKRQGLTVLMAVRDQGIGISEKDQQHLFDAFYRGENVGNIPGTGLGLLIARQALELHGGSIEVQSAPGSGSTFTLLLPLQHH
ncbi:MAG: PAS domain-containing sensor histidine kinase [Chloroflexota bacterium]